MNDMLGQTVAAVQQVLGLSDRLEGLRSVPPQERFWLLLEQPQQLARANPDCEVLHWLARHAAQLQQLRDCMAGES